MKIIEINATKRENVTLKYYSHACIFAYIIKEY